MDLPSVISGDEFFESAFYPVRLLYKIEMFYGADDTPLEYIDLVDESLMTGGKKILITICFAR